MTKYKNKIVYYGGDRFDSIKEATRYRELLLLQRAGRISELKRQVPFELIPAQYINGKCVEKSAKYIADFVYIEDGKQIVEDAKGVRTDVYKLKRKLMLYVRNIRIKEV